MSEKEWALQYTDEQYLTKRELAQALHTSLVDGYWLDVRSYRGKNAHPLAHRTISNQRFWLCLSAGVKAKIAAFENELNHLLGLVEKIDDPKVLAEVERAFLFDSLTSMAKIEKIAISSLSIKALLNGTYHEDNPAHAPVIAYLKTLRAFLAKDPEKPDADFLGEAYGSLLGEEELTKFYRTMDFDQSASRARYMTGGDFHYAPHEAVEPLMNEFFAFLLEDDIALSSRAIGAIYFLDLVKPFWEKNQELAILLAKAVMAEGPYKSLAFLLPFEAVLEANPRYESLYLETQHSGDLTYIVAYAMDLLMPLLASLESDIKGIRVEAYRSEMRPLSPEEKTLAEAQKPAPTQMSLLDEAITPVEKKPEPVLKPAEPKPASVAAEPKPVLKPIELKPVEVKPVEPKPVAPKKETTKEPVAPSEEAEANELAIEAPEAALSDKEIKEYVQYLLESNPSLNRNQAAFLANHCTMGHYYTIQQFKRSARCAYETARTSMDKLAREGYYEKKQLKNKFVYTPVKQGERK
jgi:hypothetical protein